MRWGGAHYGQSLDPPAQINLLLRGWRPAFFILHSPLARSVHVGGSVLDVLLRRRLPERAGLPAPGTALLPPPLCSIALSFYFGNRLVGAPGMACGDQ